ncbi:hypothetical protein AB0L35_29030 [Streptomyces sp. NPDC052309]|uniref:Uncharacterized protein n=1 Tax=Streptomyces griseicoloratus TaxID=2752516 RepID=A0A926QR49_9ACTN|nr:hypothetical protein [Streptomyces griseicoloratus]MBD0420551.1 hypothetical protein [Streptomyces griseicoloratus]
MGIKDQFQDKAERMQQQGKQRAEQAKGQMQGRNRRRDDDEMDPSRREAEDRHSQDYDA